MSQYGLSPTMWLGRDVHVEVFGFHVSGQLLYYQMSCKIPVHRPEVLVIKNQDGKHLLRSWDKISVKDVS